MLTISIMNGRSNGSDSTADQRAARPKRDRTKPNIIGHLMTRVQYRKSNGVSAPPEVNLPKDSRTRTFNKHRGRWLIGLLLLCIAADCCRAPARQVSAQTYIWAVRMYQRCGRPLVTNFVHCRYRPTCSEYSIQAVRRHGIVLGLAMTINRLVRCNPTVSPGTLDPVY
jgi:hypothetical protein